jgi:hypothetical protein
MTTKQHYRLVLVGGPNCGTAETYDDMASWPPPMFLYVKGYKGCYRQTRLSVPSLSEVDYSMARYEWVPA